MSATPAPKSASPRRNDWRLVRRLLPYAQQNRKILLWALVLLVPSSLGNALQPILTGQAVSIIQEEPSAWGFLQAQGVAGGLQLLVLLTLAVLLVRLVLNTVQNYLVQIVGQSVTADIRNDLFEHVTALAVRFFDRTPVGKLITRLTSDVDALGEAFSTGAIGILSDMVSIVIMTILLFTIQPLLATLMLLMLGPMAWLTVYFQNKYRVANYKAREELSSLNATLQENISGIGIVQLFRRETTNSQMFRQNNQRYIDAVDATIFYDSSVSASLEWIAFAAAAGILSLSVMLLSGDRIDAGTVATFVFASPKLFDPLRQFAEKFTAIQAGFTAIERVGELMEEPIEIQDRTATVPASYAEAVAGEIRFEHVWFGYKPDEFVLHDLDFTIRPGEKVALVGPTGAGKSSIIRLLSRLYDPTKGRILIDGTDIRDLPQAELRRRLAIILQDGFIFAGDVKSNITLGESYSLDAIKAAAAKTNVDRLIEQLPQGYDTALRERGTNLSGGQKQLLAFARAAIRDPKILVLDEATSSLDVGTEALIQEALERMLVNRTAIIIAHRLSTIRDVDRILVLKRGQLVESGSHDELLAIDDGLYASLYKLQMLGTDG
ncbi:ABC transporter ATP-binding protein [filamentous cyanobacterium LEGE 11480]|uniref:ABC transporter ATP-binding protein n=1 Tax=Romeriopsis navalis LEGE 11480 TaxID=2777977 RepID=A0A928Z4X5_9CYAN|nr:ABC transporter ATP-binding protein [Romeriopsis navalis]MBE9033076.1 ABC transporter ATP-binding protein [Romeriopsis navalis LEGE 11480]